MTFGRAAQPAAVIVEAILDTVENWCHAGLVRRSQLFVV
jgi:hypothetical protein